MRQNKDTAGEVIVRGGLSGDRNYSTKMATYINKALDGEPSRRSASNERRAVN